jgi:DNA-binding Lrp family transcriptional regulator
MSFRLDKKDRDILYQLDLNSRQSLRQVAKKVKLSREVVNYRLKRMEKRGIIRGYYTLIDVTRLGYLNYRIFVKFQKDTLEDENMIIQYYKKHPQFWWVDSPDGFRDLGMACWVRNMYEFFDIKEDLIKRFGKYVHNLDISSYHKFYIYRRAYLAGKKRNRFPSKVMFSPEKARFDGKDLEILRLLAPNARISFLEISDRTGISVSNIVYRVRKMERNGIIKDYRIMLDLQKIGYYWYKIEMQLENLDIKKEMLKYFHQHPNIVYAYETVSDNDIEVEMEVESYERFREILNEIRKIFGKNIKKYHHLLWYREHKFLFTP